MDNLIQLISKFKEYNNNIAIINKTEFRTFYCSYSKLYTYIKKFSAFLEKNNIKKGDKIAILYQNSPEYVITFLGAILKGVILIPIDIRSTKDFIEKIIKQTKPKIFFTTKYKNISSKNKIYLEDLEYLLENIKPSKKTIKINKNDIVEIVYTSGTTGTPKGVILTHNNIASNINSLEKVFKLDTTYRFLSLLPLSHLFEQTVGLFTPLNSGSSIVYISSLRPSTILNALKENITNIVIVPRLLQSLKNKILSSIQNTNKEKLFNLLLKLAEKIDFKYRKLLFLKVHKKFPYLKFFIVGGAPLDVELEKFWELMGFKIVQGYGLTESSPVISCNSPYQRKIGSVGKILPDVTVKLGKDNEILAKGSNITKGYYKNKEKTKKLFTKGWMHTGDIGYLDKENFLFIKGRKKDMIVTSEGINVYPEDIEEVLNRIQGVKESCVIGIKKQAQEEIHAVLLLEDTYKNKPKQIIKSANSKLSPHQQIQNFTVWHLEDFPRTSTMKIKKNIVLEILKKKTKPEKTITTKKDKLYSIISEIKNISIDKIKPNSRLTYDLNLSSIDRIELISAIEQEFNMDIEEDLITNKTTVNQLKNIIKKGITKQTHFRKWTLTLPIKIIQYIIQLLILFPITKIFCSIKTQGKENLSSLKSPLIFVSNHVSFFDAPVILSKLPFRFKTNIAIAALEEFFQEKKPFKKLIKIILYNLGTIFLNLYMFPQTKGFTNSIKYTGELIDKNYSILIFPEGERTLNNKMNPFKLGIGIIASNMKVPIIPIKLKGLFEILPRYSNFPKKRGKVTLKIGKPLYARNESYIDITKKIEVAVKSL